MTKRKKGAVIAALVCAAAALAAVVAYAYFGAEDQAQNLVKVGDNKITIDESFSQPDQSEDFKYRKLVKIANTGTVPCYIRVRLEFSDSVAQEASYFSYENTGKDDPAPDESTFKSAKIAEGNYIENLPEGWVYVWEKNKDVYPSLTQGYYYYTKPVEPDESTNALISWVWTKYYSQTDIHAHDIYVYAESVQTVDPVSGEDYTDTDENGWSKAWSSFAG